MLQVCAATRTVSKSIFRESTRRGGCGCMIKGNCTFRPPLVHSPCCLNTVMYADALEK